MENKVTNNIINNFVLATFKDEEEIEIITYGLKILGTNILTALIILLSGIIVGEPISAIIYLFVLILLRRNLGGYHSKTYLGCLSLTILNFMIIVILQNNLKQSYTEIIGIIFVIYSTVKIYTTTPQVHKNRIINEKTIDRCNIKKNTNLSIILFATLIIHAFGKLDFINGINYFFAISSSLMIVALSINKIKLKEEKGYEKGFN